jgi:hypothetical protein
MQPNQAPAKRKHQHRLPLHLTVKRIAQELGVSNRSVNNAVRRGEFGDPILVGRTYVIPRAQYEQFLIERRVPKSSGRDCGDDAAVEHVPFGSNRGDAA